MDELPDAGVDTPVVCVPLKTLMRVISTAELAESILSVNDTSDELQDAAQKELRAALDQAWKDIGGFAP